MISLVEFLEPIKKNYLTDKALAVLYYESRYNNTDVLSTSEIKARLVSSRIQKSRNANIGALLNQVGSYVDSPERKDGERLWKLTGSGSKYIMTILEIKADSPEVLFDVHTLETLLLKIGNPDERNYLNEALICLKVGALRATVVFAWVAAIRNLQTKCFAKGIEVLNDAIQSHDSKAKVVSSIEDFSYIKDSTVIFVCQDLRIFDKSQKDTVQEALNLRNRCGHPGKYSPKEKKVSSYLEDIISIIFT